MWAAEQRERELRDAVVEAARDYIVGLPTGYDAAYEGRTFSKLRIAVRALEQFESSRSRGKESGK